MEQLDHLAQPLAGPVTADAIEAAIQADLRAVTTAGTGRPVARTSVLTLIAAALDSAGAQRIFDAIDHLARQHPSRTIVLLPDYPVGVSDLQVWHNPVCHGGSTEGFLVCGDQIIIGARGHAVPHLASLADQLELPGLPVFLWWAADLTPGCTELFDRLTDLADRLVVDSSNFRDLGSSTAKLARLAARRHNPCAPSDLNWLRLAPWRDVLAQLFDLPAARPALDQLATIELGYDPADPAGPVQALLFIAWLAASLGWRPEPGSRLDLAGTAGQSLPERMSRAGGAVRVAIGQALAESPGLSRVALTSPGGSITATRSRDCVKVEVNLHAGGTPARHDVGFETRDRSELLGVELMTYGRDRVYESALDLAATLLQDAAKAKEVGRT